MERKGRKGNGKKGKKREWKDEEERRLDKKV